MRALLLALVFLPACAELPPVKGAISPAAQAQPYPTLVALDPLLAEGAQPSRAQAAQGPLRARAAGLRRAAIPAPASGDLAARARGLRARADALRAAPL